MNKKRYVQPMDPEMVTEVGRVKDPGLRSYQPDLKFNYKSKILAKNAVADAQKAKALGTALRRAREPYLYTSGNLRERLKPHGENLMIES